VKLVRSDKEQLTFSLGKREKQLLFHILQLYPLVPVSHQRLSKGEKGQPHQDYQRSLEEALAEQHRENRQRVVDFLGGRFHQTTKEFEFSLTVPEVEWLLQVLNDLHVGAWLMLGEPDEQRMPEVTETNAPYILAMEAADRFQCEVLAILGYSEPIPPEES